MIADRKAEIAMARSAAPERISRNATVLVLGVHGYQTASVGTNGFVCLVERIDAVRIVASGSAYFDPQIAHVVLRRLGAPSPVPSSESPLTPRELDVIRLIAEGLVNITIGERLHIGIGTVKGHIGDILEKLSASDRTQAAANALRRGLL